MTGIETFIKRRKEFEVSIYEREIKVAAKSLNTDPGSIRLELRRLGYERVPNKHGIYIWKKGD